MSFIPKKEAEFEWIRGQSDLKAVKLFPDQKMGNTFFIKGDRVNTT